MSEIRAIRIGRFYAIFALSSDKDVAVFFEYALGQLLAKLKDSFAKEYAPFLNDAPLAYRIDRESVCCKKSGPKPRMSRIA